jgi:hypothetical protein
MIKTMFLVPVADNEGRPIDRDVWAELRKRCLAFGGFTRTEGLSGQWVSESGKVFADNMVRFEIALQSWSQLSAWMDMVRWARVAFRQEALYIEVLGVPEIIGG